MYFFQRFLDQHNVTFETTTRIPCESCEPGTYLVRAENVTWINCAEENRYFERMVVLPEIFLLIAMVVYVEYLIRTVPKYPEIWPSCDIRKALGLFFGRSVIVMCIMMASPPNGCGLIAYFLHLVLALIIFFHVDTVVWLYIRERLDIWDSERLHLDPPKKQVVPDKLRPLMDVEQPGSN